ncbi:MAG: isoprenylcysteine carboxylmethyltransferase family protein [Acidobacteriaceae bacterium]|nr:isoprenylcysteine carboxylmethyltransferase family protein [Acidobacteriota bacterium]MBV9502598.1 isoprenylcysteine carboxylmethyltransferase family protein [Acidobacteriaceae bacterium]
MMLDLWRIIAAAWMTVGGVWLVTAFASKSAVKIQSPALRLPQSALMVAGYYLLFARSAAVGLLALRVVPDSPGSAYVGAVVTLAGLFIAVWARFFLGRNWSATPTIKKDHELIRSGPYAFVRHPIYFGLLLAMAGTATFVGELRGLLAVALGVIGFKWKSLTEESFMREQFGTQYDDYRSHVKALVPFIW